MTYRIKYENAKFTEEKAKAIFTLPYCPCIQAICFTEVEIVESKEKKTKAISTLIIVFTESIIYQFSGSTPFEILYKKYQNVNLELEKGNMYYDKSEHASDNALSLFYKCTDSRIYY